MNFRHLFRDVSRPTTLTLLAGMVCLLGGGTLLNLRNCNLVPSADPRLDESLAFENI